MKKTFFLKLIAVVFLLLIAFTFISKSVYSAKLPVVTFTSAGEKNLEHSLTVAGELYYDGAAEIVSPGAFEVAEVFVERGDAVFRGDPLFSVDVEAQTLDMAALELERMRVEHSLAELKAPETAEGSEADPLQARRQEYEAQRAILQHRIDRLAATYPADGIIRADEPGIVDWVQIKPGDVVQEGQVCVETHTAGAPIRVRYSLSGENARDFQVPDNTRIVVQTIARDEETGYDMLALETLSVRGRENIYDEQTGMMNVSILLSEPKGNPIMSLGAQVYMLNGIFEPYKGVLPAYCIHRDEQGEYILVINQRKSLLGIENYVTRQSVRVLDRNDMFAALSGPINQVVATSTQPLSDGDVVVVER